MTYTHKKNSYRHFNKAANSYDDNCSIQNIICLKALNHLVSINFNFNIIADFACGTGESTIHLKSMVNFKKCYALDFAPHLLDLAKNKLSAMSNIEMILADFDNPLELTNTLNLIFCNMGLQWSDNIIKTLKLWQSYLMKDGFLLISMPTDNNFKEISPPFKPQFLPHTKVINYLSQGQWQMISHDVIEISQSFNSPLAALKSLKATGTNHNKNTYKRKGLSVITFDDVFIEKNINQLTYEVGIYLARKVT